jgi:predicted metalloenzyme YecM
MIMHGLLDSTANFEKRLLAALKALDIKEQCCCLELDHICVRLDTVDSVQRLQRELLSIGRNISTAIVNGRPIYIIELYEPLQVAGWMVKCVELPHPHPDKLFQNGWEHVEFVLPCATNTPKALQEAFEELFPRLHSSVMQEKYERTDSQPGVDGDQKPNPTISLKINGVGIKFHPLSIQEVVGTK